MARMRACGLLLKSSRAYTERNKTNENSTRTHKRPVMLIVVALKALRDFIADTLELRREMMKRYPGVIGE